jgi:hypothetical protein
VVGIVGTSGAEERRHRRKLVHAPHELVQQLRRVGADLSGVGV